MTITTDRMAERYLVGRRIVAVEVRRFPDDRGGYATDPILTLDDGSELRFVAQETDTGEYGISLCRDRRAA